MFVSVCVRVSLSISCACICEPPELFQKYISGTKTVYKTYTFLKVSTAVIRTAIFDEPKQDSYITVVCGFAGKNGSAHYMTSRTNRKPSAKGATTTEGFLLCPLSILACQHLKLPGSRLHRLANKHGGSTKPAVMHTAITGSTFSSQKG